MSVTVFVTTIGPPGAPTPVTVTSTLSSESRSSSSETPRISETSSASSNFGTGPPGGFSTPASTPSSSSSTSTTSSQSTSGGLNVSSATLSSATTPVLSTATTAPASSSAAPSSAPSSSNNTGLIAGVAVLGVLLAIALGVIAFLLFRRRRRGQYSREADGAGYNRPREVTEMADRGKGGHGNITSTEIEASLLAGGGRSGASIIDDKQANAKFSKLNQDINDWVLTYFRHIDPRVENPDPEVLHALRNQPHHRSLLQDSRGKYLVLRGIVADGLTDALDNGEINGFGDVFGMKERFPTNVGARDKATWRASTVLLLEKDVGFHDRQSQAVDTIADRIDHVVSSIAGVDHSDTRRRQLTAIVQHAAELALDLAKQRMNFVLLHPTDDAFEPSVMEDVLQESRGDHLRGFQVLSVVFPAVVRYGDEDGQGFDRRNIISKALVLAAAEGTAI